ncbi:putative bifunctional diguanylate cyclase/phosphodiesterase [Acetobacterium sp.]|uniref:putative bifunctional diguanylate cyclase/phosphodiesterase n=1 Tax=Acetobacterium sp. TaxID=1872094 RepID=UPI002F3E78B4
MQWNIAPEYISLLFIVIILVYSREYNLIPTLKNKLFRLCLYYIFIEIIVSIASVIAIENYRTIPEIANQTIQTLFFLASPFLAVLFMAYLIAVVREDDPKIPTYFWINAIPYALYSVLVLTNPVTDLLYGIGESGGFIYGDGFFLTYVVPMLYMLAMIFVILINRRRMERSLNLILLSFPIISLIMLGIQWILPTLILSGSAATSALLIVYLYLQNKQIVIDDLTGLQNRKTFAKILEIYVKRKREMDIILISLDDFKVINDKFGQLNSDNLLKAVSKYLMRVVPIKSIYRYGGDEFVLMLDKDFHIPVVDMVETIRKRFSDLWDCKTCQGMLGASISVVSFPNHADTFESIIAYLEYCIGLSKTSGKGKDVFFCAEMAENIERKSHIIDLMKRGLNQDIFQVFYQPIYSVECKRFIATEALLRLSDSELGVISPDEFIPIAEEAGIIIDIGFLVLEKVCRFIRELDEKGEEFEFISCNISSTQLNWEGFVDKIIEIANRNRINPTKLHMEITESVFIDNFEHVTNMMRKLSEYGIRFNLDDFGTGFSNIANMAELPFEFIKIDKSLLYESVVSEKCFIVMQGLSRTFSDVGMKVVVEGVETKEQCKLAEQFNADYIQAFLFARPMPANEAIRYLGKGIQ